MHLCKWSDCRHLLWVLYQLKSSCYFVMTFEMLKDAIPVLTWPMKCPSNLDSFRSACIQCFYTAFQISGILKASYSVVSLVVHDILCHCCLLSAHSIYGLKWQDNTLLIWKVCIYVTMDLECDGTQQAIKVLCTFAAFDTHKLC